MEKIIELAEHLEEAVIAWFPRMAMALLLVLIGWLAAVVLRSVTRRILRGVTRIIPHKSGGFEAVAVRLCSRAEGIFPAVVFWFLILFFFAAAVETLDFPVLTNWIGEVVGYVPSILMALVIVFGGFWAGGAVGALVTKSLSRVSHGAMAGRIAQYTIAAVSIVVGIAQLGVDLSFLTTIVAIVVACLLLAGSLAFGLGARTVVGNILAAHYLEKIYRVGHEVEVEGSRGTIVSITDTFVLLETAEGRVAVPAKTFLDKTSLRSNKGPD